MRIDAVSLEPDLKFDPTKCCLMVVDRAGLLPEYFAQIQDIDDGKDEVIELHARITNNGNCEGDVRRKIGTAKPALYRLTTIWRDHQISNKTNK